MIAEVRGRGKRWRVSYPDESGIATNHPVFDKEGTLVRWIKGGVPTEALTTSITVFPSQATAEEHARFIGATEVKVKPGALPPSESIEGRHNT